MVRPGLKTRPYDRSGLISRADFRDNSIWLYGLDGGGSARRLTFGGRDQYPIWSADSQWIIFQSDRGGDRAIYANGSTAPERPSA